MTSADKGLERLYPALTALERGLLVLHAYKAADKPDPLIHRTCPSEQGAAFNRYIRLMNALNCELATGLFILREQVEKTELKYSWLMTALIWGLETQVLGCRVLTATKDRTLRKDVRRLVARAPGALRVPVDLSVAPEEPATFKSGYGDETVKALLFGIKQGLQQHWCELRAIEIAVQEVAEEFGGEDPLQTEVRDLIDDGLRSCARVRDDVAAYAEIELPEPSEDDVAQVRRLIEKVLLGPATASMSDRLHNKCCESVRTGRRDAGGTDHSMIRRFNPSRRAEARRVTLRGRRRRLVQRSSAMRLS